MNHNYMHQCVKGCDAMFYAVTYFSLVFCAYLQLCHLLNLALEIICFQTKSKNSDIFNKSILNLF